MKATIVQAKIALSRQWEAERAKRANALRNAKIEASATISGMIDSIGEDDNMNPIAVAMLDEGVSIDDNGEYRPSEEIQALLESYTAMWGEACINGLTISAYKDNGVSWLTYKPINYNEDTIVTKAIQSLAQWMQVKPKA